MQSVTSYLKAGWFTLFLVLQSHWALVPAQTLPAAPPSSAFSFLEATDGGWKIETNNIQLKQILDNMQDRFGISVSGMKNREKESVTLGIHGESLEAVLKGLMRHLGENNYAFEYDEKQVTHISVFPAAGPDAVEPGRKTAAMGKAETDGRVRTVEVTGVVEGSQAEEIGLQKGDLVIEYNGVRLNHTSGLVAETKKRTPDQRVDILILRDGVPMRFSANGGYIGVRIRSKLVAKDLLPIE